MKLSDKNFLEAVEEFTNNSLQRKEDTLKIINLTIDHNKEEMFEQLTFTAKYVCGLLRVLKTAPGITEVKSVFYIKNDLNENIKKVVDHIKKIISSSDESTKQHFDKNYFILSSQNFNNLYSLLSDLESVKKYLNHLKHQS